MRVLVQYDYPPSPGGLATQGDLLFRGLKEMGVDAAPYSGGNSHQNINGGVHGGT